MSQSVATLAQTSMRAFHPLRVKRLVEETHDAKSIVFEIPPALADAFHYRAGQFLTLEVPFQGVPLRRCYSLASSPECEAEHRVTVKRVAGGRISNWLNDNLRVGDSVSVLQPEGRFVLTNHQGPIALFGGGSGITPLIAIAKTALATTARAVTLVYANRDERSIIFRRELAELEQNYGGRLRIVHRLDAVQGFLGEADVRAGMAAGLATAECYLCGPAPFMETVERGLLAAGIDGARVHIERFASLADPGAPAKSSEPAPAATEGAQMPDVIEVELRGEKHLVPYVAGKKILELVKEAGLDAPFSCEEGFCGCCTARLVEGQVTMDADDALTADEKKKGLILTCQSRPQTRRCSIVYVD